jgi:hypothetical protein
MAESPQIIELKINVKALAKLIEGCLQPLSQSIQDLEERLRKIEAHPALSIPPLER